jgi:hypothetical protein
LDSGAVILVLNDIFLDYNLYIFAIFFSFCLFLDEGDKFYLANMKTKTIRCIQQELKFDSKVAKAFRLMSSNTQQQFIYSDRNWFNGFKLLGKDDLHRNASYNNLSDEPFVCAFFAQKRNELFIIGWK